MYTDQHIKNTDNPLNVPETTWDFSIDSTKTKEPENLTERPSFSIQTLPQFLDDLNSINFFEFDAQFGGSVPQHSAPRPGQRRPSIERMRSPGVSRQHKATQERIRAMEMSRRNPVAGTQSAALIFTTQL